MRGMAADERQLERGGRGRRGSRGPVRRHGGVVARLLRHCALRLWVLLPALLLVAGGGIARTPPAAATELLMFEKPDCPWCARFDVEVARAYANSAEGRRAPLRRLDSRARPEGIVLAAPITHSPTFVLVDGAREIGRITGYPGADFFWGLLGELMARLDAAPTPTPRRGARGPSQGTAVARAAAARHSALSHLAQ